MKHLSDNEYALGFFNLGDSDGNIPVYTYDCGLAANSGCAFELTDILTGKNEGRFTDYISFFVPKHDCKICRVKVTKL